MRVYVTSDHHFSHKNIIKYCNRPFTSVEDMNIYMMKKWNDKVRPFDLVFHLGDFAFTKKTNLQKIRDQLQGVIILIPGNHDRKKRMDECGFIVPINEIFQIAVCRFSSS